MAEDGPDTFKTAIFQENLAKALVRWQHAAGPFWPYVSATPFLSAAADLTGAFPDARGADLSLRSGEALFLDLPPTDTLGLAPALNRAGFLAVPVIQRWCSEPAVIPSADLVRALLAGAGSVRRPHEPRGAVFLLDGDRAGPKRPKLGSFDNRYTYNLNAFPPAEVLKGQGMTQVRLVSRAAPAQDLWGYLDALKRGGLRCVFS